jgi:adenosylcobinamide-GDP ribazoletransferase
MRRAVAFLTPLPVGRSTEPPDGDALVWFPLVGALVGLGVGASWWLADRWWSMLAAGAIAVVADLALTGLLHVDGLVDAADGLLPPLGERDRRLEVMADPAAGAFGVTTLVAVLLVRTAALGSRRPDVLAVTGMWAMSRTVMALAARHVPYARPGGGLATSIVSSTTRSPAAVDGALAAGAVVAILLGGWSAAAVALAAAAVVVLARARLGGFTGDVLGAAGVVGETVGLLVLAAHW